MRDWLIDRWATCRRATWLSSGRWTRSTITASPSPCCTRFNNTLPTSRRHCSLNVHVSVLVTCCHLTWITPPPPPAMFQLLSDWTFRLGRRLFITGNIARSASRRYLVYSEADFEFFAPKGQHVAPMGVKFGTEHVLAPLKLLGSVSYFRR